MIFQDSRSHVILKSATGISIGGKIEGKSLVKLKCSSGQVVIHGRIEGGPKTQVYYYGITRMDVLGGIIGGSICLMKDWEVEDIAREIEEAHMRQLSEEDEERRFLEEALHSSRSEDYTV